MRVLLSMLDHLGFLQLHGLVVSQRSDSISEWSQEAFNAIECPTGITNGMLTREEPGSQGSRQNVLVGQ